MWLSILECGAVLSDLHSFTTLSPSTPGCLFVAIVSIPTLMSDHMVPRSPVGHILFWLAHHGKNLSTLCRHVKQAGCKLCKRFDRGALLQINTVGIGVAMGQACMLLSAGTKGKRFMLPHATGECFYSVLIMAYSQL